MTIREALDAVLTDYRVHARRSIDDAAAKIRHLLAGLDPAADLASITVKRLLDYADARRAGRVGAKPNRKRKVENPVASPAQVNREIALLRHSFTLAGQPWVPGWKKLKEAPPRKGFFEWADFERVLAELPYIYRPALTFAYITGWRIASEVLSLRWEQVDFDKGMIELYEGETKSGDGRLFPLIPQLRTLLESQLEKRNGEYVFHRDGERIKEFTHECWNKACERAGMPGKKMHDFRRTAARNLFKATKDRQVSMKLIGHKTESVFIRYRITDETDLRDAAGALSKMLDQQCQKKAS